MSENQNNPCLGCSTNQHCCSRLSGLVLAEEEFNRLFRQYERELTVRRSNRVVFVSAAEGKSCPYWRKDGCQVYEERPVDCRLFPYIPLHVIEKRKSVKMVYHGRSDCPQKRTLFPLMRESELHALLTALAKKMYGESKKVLVSREKGAVSRLRNRLEAAISRRLYR